MTRSQVLVQVPVAGRALRAAGVMLALWAGSGCGADEGLQQWRPEPLLPGAPLPGLPGAPQQVEVVAGEASLRVTWSPPSPDTGPVEQYEVRCAPDCGAQRVEAHVREVRFEGLLEEAQYTLGVAALNARGEGPLALSVAVRVPKRERLPGAPTGVTATAGDAAAQLRWTAPSKTGGSALRSYTVRCEPACAPLSVPASTPSATVAGLQNGTAYTFRVSASNDAGEGPQSAASNAVTPQGSEPPPPPPPPAAAERWVSAYYVGYQRELYPETELDFSTLTHLIVGRVTPLATGALSTHFDIDDVTGPAMARTLSQRAHAAGRKALLMVGGEGEHDNFASAASEANRARFVANLLGTMDGLGYDGLDLDWEPILPEDHAPLLALLQALRAQRPGLLLTVPVGWVNANFPEDADPFYAQLAAQVDQLNLMSYSMAGAWGGWDSWHHAALYDAAPSHPSSVDSTVRAFLAAGVPAAKLGVGLGFYGSCWTGVSTPRVPITGGVAELPGDNAMSYANIVSLYAPQATRSWDERAQAPYLSSSTGAGPQRCNFISYEDPQSILAKGAYARSAGLGGAIVWTVNQGHLPAQPAGSRDPLMQAAYQGFLAP